MLFDMSASEGERRLTPAARQSLDELTAAYRARLLEQAMIETQDGEISAIDFMRSVYASPEGDEPNHARIRAERQLAMDQNRLRRARQVATLTAVFSVLIGGLVVAIFVTLFDLSLPYVVPLIATPLLTINALAISRYFRIDEELRSALMRTFDLESRSGLSASDFRLGSEDTYSDPTVDEINSRFMSLWNLLEHKLEELAGRVLPDTGRRSIGTIIKQLTYDGTLTEYEANQIKRMLTVRNDLVHGELPKNYVLRDQLREIMSVNNMLTGLLDNSPPLSPTGKSALTANRIVEKSNDDRTEGDEPQFPE